jgi:hypothetical protein
MRLTGKDLRVFVAAASPVVSRGSRRARMDLAPGKIERWSSRVLGCEWPSNSDGAPEVVSDASYTLDEQRVFERECKPLQ